MKKMMVVLIAVMLMFGACAGMAEDQYDKQRENAIAALKVSMPDAEVDFAVREYDDGQVEWHIFFSQGKQIGECKVIEKSNELRRVELYNRSGALGAKEVMDKLIAEKGEMTIHELDLDWDDGFLLYEGEAEQGGMIYEFEITADGRVVEWERD